MYEYKMHFVLKWSRFETKTSGDDASNYIGSACFLDCAGGALLCEGALISAYRMLTKL